MREFKIGDRVVRIFNGDMGVATEVTAYAIRVKWDSTRHVGNYNSKWMRPHNGLELIKKRHSL